MDDGYGWRRSPPGTEIAEQPLLGYVPRCGVTRALARCLPWDDGMFHASPHRYGAMRVVRLGSVQTSFCDCHGLTGEHLMPTSGLARELGTLRARWRDHQWSGPERAALISAIAISLAALFVTTYSLALGHPVPHGIPIAIIGNQDTPSAAMDAVTQVAVAPKFQR